MVKRIPARTSPRAAPGVILVDAIVGTVLLGIALAVMMSMLSQAISSQTRGEELQNAALLIDEQLNLVLARGPDSYGKQFPLEGPCEAPFAGYRYKLTIDGGQGGTPYHVVAEVSWLSGGRERSTSCETLIAPRLGDDPDPIRKPGETVSRDF